MRNLSYMTTELPQFSPPSMRVRLEAFQRLFDACEIDRFEPRVKLNYEKDMITERDVNYYWQEYAGRLPQEQTAIAKRMQAMKVALLDDHACEVMVDNPIVAKDFNSMVPELQDYLRRRLKNRKVTIAVRVSKAGEVKRAYSRVEKFQMMAEKNKALLELKEQFGLEFA